MARLRTIGFEIQGVSTGFGDASGLEGGLSADSPPTINTSTVRSGSNSLKIDSGANFLSNLEHQLKSAETALGRTHYFRVYLNVTSFPDATTTILEVQDTGAVVRFEVKMTSSGALQLFAGGSQVGSNSSALNTGQWYRIEVSALLATGSTDACELKIDGASVASGSGLNIADFAILIFAIGWGAAGAGTNKIFYADDFAWNDDQGSSQNSWPGDGKCVLLKPISDNAVGTGWLDGDGAGTLFGSVDNTPPVGVGTAADGTQIKNLTSTTTGNYDANMTTYTTAGLVASDTVQLVQGVCSHSEDIATGTKAGALQIVSNPAQAAEDTFDFGDDVGANGTWPSGWRSRWGTAQYLPSVTLGTSPVLRVGKRQADTRQVDVDFMGIMVEYVPAAAGVGAKASRMLMMGVR